MGWTYTRKDKNTKIIDFFKEEFNSERGEVVDCAVVARRTAYIAYRYKAGNLAGHTFALVCLLDYRNYDYCNFGYKDMDESMGPCEAECPERILNLLSPLSADVLKGSGYALEWRVKCYANLANKKTLKNGDIIQFATPLHFTNGDVIQDFQVVKMGRKVRFHALGKHWQKYQITKWENREFTVIQPPFPKEG